MDSVGNLRYRSFMPSCSGRVAVFTSLRFSLKFSDPNGGIMEFVSSVQEGYLVGSLSHCYPVLIPRDDYVRFGVGHLDLRVVGKVVLVSLVSVHDIVRPIFVPSPSTLFCPQFAVISDLLECDLSQTKLSMLFAGECRCYGVEGSILLFATPSFLVGPLYLRLCRGFF